MEDPEGRRQCLDQKRVIIGYEIVKGDSGYSSVPTLTVPGHPAAAPTVLIAYGKDLDSNGRVSVVSLPAPKTK